MPEKKTINDLIELFFSTSKLIKEKLKSDIGCQLSPVHLGLLKFIRENGSPTMHELADYLSVSAPAATSFIENLIKNGMLERIDDKSDRRIIRVAISQAGQKKLELTMTEVRRSLGGALEKMTKEQLEILCEALNKLNASFS